jgi:fibronectin type 3 domain-containing protein
MFSRGDLVNGWTRLATSNPVIVPASVMLAWDANTDANLAGYEVYVGTSSGAYSYWVDVGNITKCTVGGLPPGNVYYVAVTAYDQSGAESDFSNEVSVAK